MRLKISHGTVVHPGGRFPADVVAEDGVIRELAEPGRGASADVEVDARGLLVFPGFIDPHVHSRDPGLTEKEDFAHSTRSAAAGGITTLCEMPNAVPPVADVATFHDRVLQHSEVASVDFALWGISLGGENLGELRGLVEAGVAGIKLFWGYALDRATRALVYNLAGRPPEDLVPPPGNGDVYDVFKEVAAAGGLLAAHCEDRGVIEASERALGHGVETYADLLAVRPDTAEATAIAIAAEFARATGCRFHVVHVSSARGAEIVRRARAEGVTISAETCPHYLALTERDYARIGPRMKIYPPIRHGQDLDALWSAVNDGTIASIGSDHAPHTIEEKSRSLAAQPAGCAGVETLAPVMLGEMAAGRVTAERLAYVCSEGTARIYGLYPRKGAIRPGSDADFTIVDPDLHWRIDEARLHSKHRLSPFAGRQGRGRPVCAVLRGQVIMRDGEPQGEPRGRPVKPERARAAAAGC